MTKLTMRWFSFFVLLLVQHGVKINGTLSIYHRRETFVANQSQGVTVHEVEGVAVLDLGRTGVRVNHFFDCNSTTQSASNLRWGRENGSQRFPTSRELYSLRLNMADFPVGYSDVGIYTCTDSTTGAQASINITGGAYAIISEMSNYEIALGSGGVALLKVFAAGNPPLRVNEIVWYGPNRNRITSGGRFQLLNGNTILVISNVQLTDRGTYRIDICRTIIVLQSCVQATTTIVLNVLSVARSVQDQLFVTSLPAVLFLGRGVRKIVDGSVVWLYCKVNSIRSTLTVTWNKDGVPLVQDVPHIRIRNSTSVTSTTFILMVDNFQASDDGTYQCNAQDERVRASGTALILTASNSTVDGSLRIVANDPAITTASTNTSAPDGRTGYQVGENVSLSFEIGHVGDDSTSYSTSSVIWLKDGGPVRTTPTNIPGVNGHMTTTLSFTFQESDDGVYQCVIAGNNLEMLVTLPIRVDTGETLTFERVSPSSIIILRPPEKLVLEVRAAGRYQEMIWRRNGVPFSFSPGGDFRVTLQEFSHFFEIFVREPTNTSDLGMFSVQLLPAFGSVQDPTNGIDFAVIAAVDANTTVDGEGAVAVIEGGSVDISCTSTGVPAPNITWKLNNESVPFHRTDITTPATFMAGSATLGKVVSTLHIVRVRPLLHLGVYQCIGNNGGSTSSSVNVSVIQFQSNVAKVAGLAFPGVQSPTASAIIVAIIGFITVWSIVLIVAFCCYFRRRMKAKREMHGSSEEESSEEEMRVRKKYKQGESSRYEEDQRRYKHEEDFKPYYKYEEERRSPKYLEDLKPRYMEYEEDLKPKYKYEEDLKPKYKYEEDLKPKYKYEEDLKPKYKYEEPSRYEMESRSSRPSSREERPSRHEEERRPSSHEEERRRRKEERRPSSREEERRSSRREEEHRPSSREEEHRPSRREEERRSSRREEEHRPSSHEEEHRPSRREEERRSSRREERRPSSREERPSSREERLSSRERPSSREERPSSREERPSSHEERSSRREEERRPSRREEERRPSRREEERRPSRREEERKRKEL